MELNIKNWLKNFLRTLIVSLIAGILIISLSFIKSNFESLQLLISTAWTMLVMVLVPFLDNGLRHVIEPSRFTNWKRSSGQNLLSQICLFFVCLPIFMIANIEKADLLPFLFAIHIIFGAFVSQIWRIVYEENSYKPVLINSLIASHILASFCFFAWTLWKNDIETFYISALLIVALTVSEFILSTISTVIYHGLTGFYQVSFWHWTKPEKTPEAPTEAN